MEKKQIQAIKMEFYKTRIFEERPKWDKSWSEDVTYSDESSEESPAHRLDQVEERLSDPAKGENGITQPKTCSI